MGGDRWLVFLYVVDTGDKLLPIQGPSKAHPVAGFDNKVKIAGQVHLRGLLFGKDPLQVFGVLLLLLQQDAIHHFPVHLRPEIDVCAERTVGGIDLIVCQGTVLRGLEPAQPVEQGVQMEHLVAVELTVVAQQHNICVLHAAGLLQRIQHKPHLSVNKAEGVLQISVHAQAVALVVNVGQVEQHQVGAVGPDDVGGALGGELVHLWRLHPAEHVLIGLKNLLHRRAVGPGKPRCRVILLLRGPDLANIVLRS